MGQWNFMPWNMQYLGGGLLALTATIIVFRRGPRTFSSYKWFLAYGTCVVAWMFSVLLGRSAPSLATSTAFYRVVMIAFFLTQPMFLLTILQIASQRRIYYLTLLPALFMTAYAAAETTFDVYSTSFGWAYSLRRQFVPVSTVATITYAAAIITVLSVLAVRRRLLYLKKKYAVILAGFLLYFIPLSITNMSMWNNPDVRPFGGFLLATEFVFIAYALYLKPERIEFAGGQSANALNDRLFKFVRRLRELMPGKELGGDAARFDDTLRSVGLSDTVSGSSRQVFDAGPSPRLDMLRTMDGVTSLMRRQPWARQATAEYTELFVEVYRKMHSDSASVAREWLYTMLRSHGGFMDKLGVLAATPLQEELPQIFRELKRGGVYLLKEERPAEAYKQLNEAVEYGFDGLCFSKLEPKNVRDTFGVKKATLFWVTFQQLPSEEAINPKDLERVSQVTSLAATGSTRSVILLDALDHIVFANPFEPVRGLLRAMKNTCVKEGSSLLVSVNPELFVKEQMEAIEQDLLGT